MIQRPPAIAGLVWFDEGGTTLSNQSISTNKFISDLFHARKLNPHLNMGWIETSQTA
jgi:hypothetical protein